MTPHSSGTSSSGEEGVRSANGVTTYTPRASVGSSVTHADAGNSRTIGEPAARLNTNDGINTGKGPARIPGSHPTVSQINTARSGLTGINKRPIPSGQVSASSDGRFTVNTANGRKFDVRPDGTLASFHKPGESANFRANGHLASLHTPTLDIEHGAHGERTIVTHRPDHSTVVSTGRHSGYVERPVVHGGHSYIQRTYVSGGKRFSRTYTTYKFHGHALDHYVPGAYYAPAFYGWAFYPWDAAATCAWGWAALAWYGCDQGYFSPSGTYPGAANWLTDYLLGQTLAAGYDADASASGCPSDGAQADDSGDDADAQAAGDDLDAQTDTPISPDIRQAIADEVDQQLAYENAASTQPDPATASSLTDLPQVLTPNHVFVVSQPLNIFTADSQSCALEAGNVLRLVAAPAADAAAADLTVVSSRRGDCPAGVQVTISLQDLEEMQNNFRAQLDSGLQTLHSRQGQGGLPAAPYSAISPPPKPAGELPADTQNVQVQLDTQQRLASQAEQGVAQTAFAGQQ